tara:strand:+ start:2369 stop:3151 length:783 start_codon:yes stop_codon:yes gene_type:complete
MNLSLFLNKLKIREGDKIVITSDILKLLIKSRAKKIKFDPNEFIDIIKKKIGKQGTLLIPTFNWDFFKGKIFYSNKTLSQSGALGNIALRRKDFSRTFNPVYSFAVTGKDKKKLCSQRHINCFSLNSPFGYLIKNKGKNLFVDLHQRVSDETKLNGFPFHHVVEQAVGVPYRFIKEFNGYLVNNKKKKEKILIKFYARNLKFKYNVYISKKLDKALLNKKILDRKKIQGINFDLLKLKPTFNILKDDLRTYGRFFVKKNL